MGSVVEEVTSIGRDIDDIAHGSGSAHTGMELLEKLAQMPIDIDIITKTSIGLKINNLRKKTSDEKLAKRAKLLIKEWKSLLDSQGTEQPPTKLARKDSNTNTKNDAHTESRKEKERDEEKRKKPSKEATPPTPKPSVVAEFSSSSFPPKHLETDESRLKPAQLLLSALRSGEMPQGTLDPEELAVQIEATIHQVAKGNLGKYSVAMRSRIFNLRDKKNPALRENVLTGVVKPAEFAVMTSDQMASPEMRDMREKFNKEGINEHQMSIAEGTPSEMFKCGKCGSKKCTYTQLQTRSSDEPMTTFVFCLACGNRWKFC